MDKLWEVIQFILDGLSVGGLYGLIAIGYTMVFGVLQLVNFAHGELYMVGAYLGMFFLGMGFPIYLAVPLTCVAVGFFSVISEKLLYKPLRASGKLPALITAVGLSLFLQNVVQSYYSPNPQSYPLHLPDGIWEMGEDIMVRQRDVYLFGLAIALTLALEWFVRHTKMGSGIRAIAMHPQAARLVGVNYNRGVSITFFIGAALASIAGICQGMAINQVFPLMGMTAGLKAFAAAVLGGIGVFSGALVGGLVLGVVESLLVGFDYSTYKDAVAFGILIIMLLLRPQGLLGKARMVKV